jgi:hypothetical protein
MHVRTVLLSLSFFFCSVPGAFAQTALGGAVSDPQAAVVPNARVALLADQNEVRATRADAQGRYRFETIAPGRYVLTVSGPGFETATTLAVVTNLVRA